MAASKELAMARRIELWPVERLVPYERNARTHSPEQVAQLAASISEFGFLNPILVDSKDGIIAGHGRLAAAKDMGLTEVPVVVLDHLTEAQKRAYVLADNKLALNAGWDEKLLQIELTGLQLQDFDLSLIGFDEDELGKLLGSGEFDGSEEEPQEQEPLDRGVALAIVLTSEEMLQWRKAKAELGYSTDKAAFWKLVEDLLEEVAQ